MYKIPRYKDVLPEIKNTMEGETIEDKVNRLVNDKEPIKDGAPLIFTDRKDGVNAGYNIKTDRFEVAVEAMDRLTKMRIAQRENVAKSGEQPEAKVIEMKDGKAEPTPGKVADGQ